MFWSNKIYLSQEMKWKIEDIWIKIKVFLHLPLPIRNHFYKGRRISFIKNWFCQNCMTIFPSDSWEKYSKIKLQHFLCPNCGSPSVMWSTRVFEAIVDKLPPEVILKISKQHFPSAYLHEKMMKEFETLLKEKNMTHPAISYDATFDIFRNGNTDGIPRFDNQQVKDILFFLKPDSIDDLAIILYLDKPGILSNGKKFLTLLMQRKHDPGIIPYIHPILSKHLTNTYGYVLYEEQFISILMDIAGLTATDADNIRKSMNQKRVEEIKIYYTIFQKGCLNYPYFIKGCNRNGKNPVEIAEALWRFLIKCNDILVKKESLLLPARRAYKIAYLMTRGLL